MIGLDWRIPLDDGWKLLRQDVAVQGNLDPALLLRRGLRSRSGSTISCAARRAAPAISSTWATAFCSTRPWRMSKPLSRWCMSTAWSLCRSSRVDMNFNYIGLVAALSTFRRRLVWAHRRSQDRVHLTDDLVANPPLCRHWHHL